MNCMLKEFGGKRAHPPSPSRGREGENNSLRNYPGWRPLTWPYPGLISSTPMGSSGCRAWRESFGLVFDAGARRTAREARELPGTLLKV